MKNLENLGFDHCFYDFFRNLTKRDLAGALISKPFSCLDCQKRPKILYFSGFPGLFCNISPFLTKKDLAGKSSRGVYASKFLTRRLRKSQNRDPKLKSI